MYILLMEETNQPPKLLLRLWMPHVYRKICVNIQATQTVLSYGSVHIYSVSCLYDAKTNYNFQS